MQENDLSTEELAIDKTPFVFSNFTASGILQSCSKMLAHLTLTVRYLTPTSITSIATPPPFPRSMLFVVCYTSKVLHNIDKGDRGVFGHKIWHKMCKYVYSNQK
jgi:hypothetical protein